MAENMIEVSRFLFHSISAFDRFIRGGLEGMMAVNLTLCLLLFEDDASDTNLLLSHNPSSRQAQR